MTSPGLLGRGISSYDEGQADESKERESVKRRGGFKRGELEVRLNERAKKKSE